MAALIATKRYEREEKRLLSPEESAQLRDELAVNADRYPVIPASGGLRKMRWKRQGKGKRGGVRVIYFYWISDDEVYLIFIYGKNEQADMGAADRKFAKQLIEEVKHAKQISPKEEGAKG